MEGPPAGPSFTSRNEFHALLEEEFGPPPWHRLALACCFSQSSFQEISHDVAAMAISSRSNFRLRRREPATSLGAMLFYGDLPK
jgi:hypothetical protein